MGKKYLETKKDSLESSVLGVWKTAIEEGEAIRDAAQMTKKEDDLDEVKTPKYGTINLSKRSGGATVSAREVPGYGMEAYTFSNKTQADKHAKKVGGETYHFGRVFYVRMKESVESDETLEGMKEEEVQTESKLHKLQKLNTSKEA